MVKIIAVGDQHFQKGNLVEVDMFISRITELATEQEPDLIVLLGDLLHTHEKVETPPLNKAYELIHNMRKVAKTYVLVGNHDMCNNQVFLTDSHWLNGMKEWENVVIVDKVVIEVIDGEKLVFVPYVYPGRFEEALSTHGDDWMEASCIFAHQEFYGCKMGAKISEDGDKWSLEYPSVISGHIHSRQTPQENVYYPGASMQHAFGESEKNVIACIDALDGAYSLTEVDIALPRKRTVYVDVTDLEESIPEKTDDKIRIVVSGNPDEFKAMKRTKVFKELNVRDDIKVVFKPKRIELQRRDDDRQEAGKTSENIKEVGVRFLTILSNLVTAESNDYLLQSYRELVQDI